MQLLVYLIGSLEVEVPHPSGVDACHSTSTRQSGSNLKGPLILVGTTRGSKPVSVETDGGGAVRAAQVHGDNGGGVGCAVAGVAREYLVTSVLERSLVGGKRERGGY
jgi:hypothetical protein